MIRLSRYIVAVALMLCLPLQGLAAIAMPIGMAQGAAAAASMEHAAGEMSDHCMKHDAQPEKSTTACDHCFTCHLSVAQALTPFSAGIRVVPAVVHADPFGTAKPATLSFPFFRPPISA